MTLRPTSATELAEMIGSAGSRGQPLRIIGQGTWLDGGSPVRADATPLHLDAFRDVIEYEPGDLTITVGASLTIAELDALTAAHHQWCPLSPWGGDGGSVGATIATATPGPYARALGLPRDLVLGLECVDGTGKVLRPGGKVVKNVAGFDLTRLMTGAWGSLGAITRVSLRLRARPAADETWIVTGGTERASAIVQSLRASNTTPIACEIIGADAAAQITSCAEGDVLVRIAGNAAFVAAARTAIAALGSARPADVAAWTDLRSVTRDALELAPMPPGVRALNERVKQTFDPANILNPGIMG